MTTKFDRQKLIQAIIYFASNTKYCGKIKLFKLLYLLDFEHFRQTGKSVTGFEYQAWKFGPVPVDLMEEWEEFGPDLAQVVHIEEERVIDYDRQAVKVNEGVAFDSDEFTPRQLRIMETLAAKYRETYSPKLIDVTHEQNGAWDKIWHGGEGAHRTIPYDLAIPDNAAERDALLEIASEQRMYREALHAARLNNAA
ncbi:MAG: hypothetical protein C0522_01740 [Rhodocyclaceae bacterium]|jgi:uncharacterized phage-associated protein|nr:hypothetical protein [Rhodocyclaceae bacterium]